MSLHQLEAQSEQLTGRIEAAAAASRRRHAPLQESLDTLQMTTKQQMQLGVAALPHAPCGSSPTQSAKSYLATRLDAIEAALDDKLQTLFLRPPV